MSTQTTPNVVSEDIEIAKPEITQEDVAHFLRTHSDFFVYYPKLIETLAIPHETGEAVSLVERQVAVLRKKNKELGRKLHQLVTAARENEKVMCRLHALALRIVTVEGFDETLAEIIALLHSEFPGTWVRICLLNDLPVTGLKGCESMQPGLLKSRLVQDLFSGSRRRVAILNKRQIEGVFEPGKDDQSVHSAVAVALKKNRNLGVLFLGSTDANRFQSDKGTLYLGNLGEIVSAKLHQFSGT